MSLFFESYLAPLVNERSNIVRGRVFLKERKEFSKSGEEDLLSVSEYSGVTKRSDNLGDGEYLSRAETLEGYRKVQKNDLVMNYMLAWKGALGVSDIEGITSPAYSVFLINSEYAEARFIHALFRSELFHAYFRTESTGIIESRLRLYPEALMSLKMVLPPLNEQQDIATKIDHETTRIDALIEKKTRFIELLQEKRQAMITQAVTKGLDPDAKLKDSGVEWLGQVPEHWEIKRLQFLCTGVKAGPFGSSLTKDMYVSTGYRVYGQEQVIPGDFSIGDYYISPEYYSELSQYAVSPGDILISCVGTFGKIAVVPEDVEPGIINPRLIRIRVNKTVSPLYLTTLLRSGVVSEQFALWSRGGTMDIINIGILANIVLAIPPLNQQHSILSFLGFENTHIDNLIQKNEHSIDLLKERRSALITAAVTGQIDLREVPHEPDPS